MFPLIYIPVEKLIGNVVMAWTLQQIWTVSAEQSLIEQSSLDKEYLQKWDYPSCTM